MPSRKQASHSEPTEPRITVRRYVDKLLAADTESKVAMRDLTRTGWEPENEWGCMDARAKREEQERRSVLFAAYVRTLQRIAQDARPELPFSGPSPEAPSLEERHDWRGVTKEDADRLRELLDGDQRSNWFTWKPGEGLKWQRPAARNDVRRMFPLLARAAEILWDAILGHCGFELQRCEWERCRKGHAGGPGLFVAMERGTKQNYCSGSCRTMANRAKRS